MKKKNKELLLDVHRTIEQLYKNDISHEETIKLYKNHLIDLKESSPEIESQSHSTALLYNHSVNNLCKLSSLINFKDKKINVIEYVGEEKIIEALDKISDEELVNFKEEEPNKIFGKYHLIYSHINQDVFFAAITSSKLFDIELFLKIADIFRTLYNNFFKLSEQRKFDYFSIQCEALEEYMTINDLKDMTCHIFAFESIHEIYGHMGIFTIHSISTMIRSQLTEYFENSKGKLFPMSVNSYLIFSQKNQMPEMHFDHKDITLPFHHTSLAINNETTFHSVIDAFINLNNNH